MVTRLNVEHGGVIIANSTSDDTRCVTSEPLCNEASQVATATLASAHRSTIPQQEVTPTSVSAGVFPDRPESKAAFSPTSAGCRAEGLHCKAPVQAAEHSSAHEPDNERGSMNKTVIPKSTNCTETENDCSGFSLLEPREKETRSLELFMLIH